MIKLLLTILVALLFVSVTLALTQEESDVAFSAVVSGSLGDDTARKYIKIKTLTTFTAVGASINGTLGGPGSGDGSIQLDYTIFTFSTLTLNFLFAYSKAKVDISNFNPSASANAYLLNYRPTAIIEYLEKNDVAGFQYGQDDILGWVRLDKLVYSIDDQSQSFNNENGAFQVSIYEVKSNIFSMMFYITEAPVSVAGNDLGAGQSKIDIAINNYYDSSINKKGILCDLTAKTICTSTGPSSNENSRLALASIFINANADFNVDTQGDIVVKSDINQVNVGLSWVGHADVTANGKSVSASVSTNANSTVNGNFFATADGFASGSAQILIHSFDAVRPNSLVWDPSMGAGKQDTNSGIKVVIPSLMIILSVLVALLI